MLASYLASTQPFARGQERGVRPLRDNRVQVLNPRNRVPVSWIIDDSTCLVNLNRFAIPQFATAWGGGPFDHDWRAMPAEIPDSFVIDFGTWCAEHGVKGKYSIVPFPACVGRLDRELPGWTRRQVDDSLDVVRRVMLPNWDIHPEMVTHTWVIDPQTGHPFTERSKRFMENWDWTTGRSTDELAHYLAYALKILRNVNLPCEGITTPGGFGNRVLPELSQATFESCRDVYRTEIPHYFRHLYDSGDTSVAPRVEYAQDLNTSDPRCVVSIIGCTGDWTGGWDCRGEIEVDRFISEDLSTGRLIEVIERGEPAIMVCHWTGIYYNGQQLGFQALQQVVTRLHQRYDNLIWMKLSEIARYWAAKELTSIQPNPDSNVWQIDAPFATPHFTLQLPGPVTAAPQISQSGEIAKLKPVASLALLESGTYFTASDTTVVCWDLRRGHARITT